uniref:G-protein coupled receptors family 3 profile domain-containing protein n=1 Tax=Lates calcarifer TaxID=8187 RepID=A0A4W6CGX7_LATCA
MFLPWFFVSIMSVFHSCSGENGLLRAYSNGDIIIGGLFPLHSKTNRTTTPGPLSCSAYDFQNFLRSQVMIYAIREINQLKVLPNFTIGYDIYDTCGDVSLAIRATLELLRNQSDPQCCLLPAKDQSALPEPKVKVVIGERYSEVSIAVARIVALSSVAQISYASTSEQLSKKLKFPTFLRTISSDEHQTKAIAELVRQFNWKSVAIVGSDDEYGKYGSDRLEYNFQNMKICIEFIEILPGYFSHNSSESHKCLTDLLDKIINSSAEAIILFTKTSNVELIMKAAITHRLNRTWIASDTWSTSSGISAMQGIKLAGQVFGFISKRNEVPGFKDYVISMGNGSSNTILQDYLNHRAICSNQSETENSSITCIANRQPGWVQAMSALKLLTNFTVNTTHIFFDANGDPSIGYDIVYWSMNNSTDIKTIGEYWPNGGIKIPHYLVKKMGNVNVSVISCCGILIFPLQLNSMSLFPSVGTKCERCGEGQYSSPKKNECWNKSDEFLGWTDPFIIFLCVLGVSGIIISIVFAILFLIYHSTPIVKAVGGYLCFLELFSLLACFCLTFSFVGIPTNLSCMVGLPLFGMVFSLCISCILANLLQILVGFSFDLRIGSWMKKLNQPVAVVTIVSGIQLILCVLWLYYCPPFLHKQMFEKTILYQCNKGCTGYFIAMLTYNAFLALICFLFAFKGKQLPDLYKNASLITTSMLLFLIVWILFIPIYINLIGKYKIAIESAAILISSYSILGFHLAPKCYIMVFRKEINNENAITEYIRKHYEQRGMAVVKS